MLEPSRVDKLILVDSGGYPAHSTSTPLGFRIARLPGLNQMLSHTLPRFLIESGMRNVFGDPAKVTVVAVTSAPRCTGKARSIAWSRRRSARLIRFSGASADRFVRDAVPSSTCAPLRAVREDTSATRLCSPA